MWKRTFQKGTVAIETTLFTRPTITKRRTVAVAARQYGRFLGLPVVLE